MFNTPVQETPLQTYLRSGKTIEDLQEEFGIMVYEHPTLPLVGFKYNQIESPKTDPVVRSCRGTVLEKNTWNMVAQPFYRFFNYGEHLEETSHFNWGDFDTATKEDGSLAIVYYYDGEWHMNTSGSFGLGDAGFYGGTWRDLFWETAGIDKYQLNIEYTYIFELCTMFNQVVRQYPDHAVYLLGVMMVDYPGSTGIIEMNTEQVIEQARLIGVSTPDFHHFEHYQEVKDFLKAQEESDPTFEGLILRDSNNMRMKVKTETYLALHHLADNGNIANPKNIIPFVLAGEKDEILTYFPRLEDSVNEVEEKLDAELNNLLKVWDSCKHHETQKDFALAIMPETKFSGILFQVRGKDGDADMIKTIWRDSAAMIHKFLWKS